MGFLNRTVAWSIIIKNVVIIGGIVLAVFYLGTSIYANLTENPASDNNLPKPPSINKAAYVVTIRNTGNILYTDSFEHPSDNIYILDNYWEINDGKYKERKHHIVLDKEYFGDIIIQKRGN